MDNEEKKTEDIKSNDSKKKSRGFKLKPTWFDAIIFGITAVVAGGSWIGISAHYQKLNSNYEPVAEVYYDNKMILSQELNKIDSDGVSYHFLKTEYPKLVSDITVTFDNEKGVAITENGCPTQDCVHTGYINKIGKSIVCLPSSFYITIVGGDEIDAVIGCDTYEE